MNNFSSFRDDTRQFICSDISPELVVVEPLVVVVEVAEVDEVDPDKGKQLVIVPLVGSFIQHNGRELLPSMAVMLQL